MSDRGGDAQVSDGGRPESFGDRLLAVWEERGRLCVGIDPHPGSLREWGLADDAAGARDFGLRVIDAATGRAGIVKPQVALFERHAADGFAALQEVLSAARASGLLVIADVKRGEIGSSMVGYADAWLRPGSPLEVDAVTLSPYLGVGSLSPTLDAAERAGKGAFVLAATSNPEALDLQSAVVAHGARRGSTVAAAVVADVAERAAGGRLAPVGVVVGATLRLIDVRIRPAALERIPVLAPGFGHQGARIADARSIFGAAHRNLIVASSRGILSAGPDGLVDRIAADAEESRW